MSFFTDALHYGVIWARRIRAVWPLKHGEIARCLGGGALKGGGGLSGLRGRSSQSNSVGKDTYKGEAGTSPKK